MRLKILVLFFLLGCTDDMQFSQQGIICSKVSRSQLEPDFIAVFYDRGQSNIADGRAEASRLALTEYPSSPARIYRYWKTNTTSTDNGTWEPIVAGANTREYDQTATMYGASLIAAIKLRDHINRDVYIIGTGDGGTSLTSGTGTVAPDWDPASSGENYDISRDYYFDVAISKLIAANPGKQIVVFKSWWQGETDAADATATAAYAANFAALDAADQDNSYLQQGIWLISKLDYNRDANEATINAALDAFVSANPNRAYIWDPAPYPQKIELTVGEKGGFTPSAADDIHTSYLGQNAFGEWKASTIISHYAIPSAGLSEITDNTTFDPSTINADWIRLQMNRDNVTIGADNIVSAVVNDLGGVVMSPATTVRFKVDNYKGALAFPGYSPTNTGRIESASAIGTTYFSQSFSFSCWFKPSSAIPPAANHFLHDIQNTSSANNSRVSIFLSTAGKLAAIYSQGGTAVQATTAAAVFASGKTPSWHHLAVTFDDTNNIIKIYFDGVLQTLDAAPLNGDLSTVTMASYINGTNKLQIGARRTGASTYGDYFFGMMREVTLQPGVYTQTDIDNLMLN